MRAAYVLCTMSLLFLALFYYSASHANRFEVFGACSFLGFFLVPMLFVAYELAVEQVSHLGVGDNMSCGLINLYANFFGFIVAISLTPALNKESLEGIQVTYIVLFVNLAVALMFLALGQMCS